MRPPAAHKLTYDDFLCFPDDGRRHELIDGEHYVTPSPFERHQRVSVDLTLALGNHLRISRVGSLYVAPFDVVLSNHDVVEPDLLVILADQQDILTEKHVRGAPAILIEILSPGTRRRDETLKRDLYERAGVREYWMVDPDARTITVCRQIGSPEFDCTTELRAASGDVLTSRHLPGFSLALARLFEDQPARRR
jgi:Uma2 family endonuclease